MIAIIDYGVGNLRSVEKAFHFLGYEALVTDNKSVIEGASSVVLPGVGAFADAMGRLKKSGLDKTVYNAVESGKPFLGICLGMQLLFDYSEEGGKIEGLGIIHGGIKLLPQSNGLKVPHMGWNSLNIKKNSLITGELPQNPYVYFVHSYYLDADDKEDVIATTNYGVEIDVAVNHKNVYATQFHPEKSGNIGLKMLENFAKQTN